MICQKCPSSISPLTLIIFQQVSPQDNPPKQTLQSKEIENMSNRSWDRDGEVSIVERENRRDVDNFFDALEERLRKTKKEILARDLSIINTNYKSKRDLIEEIEQKITEYFIVNLK
jgi:vacuolar-type H+-ATPase subunit E/Vma4